jgi:hypothetical protein
MSLLSSLRAAPNRAVPGRDLRHDAAASVTSLMQTIAHSGLVNNAFHQTRSVIDQLSASDCESKCSAVHLNRAQRFLRSDEVGSALYELQLLVSTLQRD